MTKLRKYEGMIGRLKAENTVWGFVRGGLEFRQRWFGFSSDAVLFFSQTAFSCKAIF